MRVPNKLERLFLSSPSDAWTRPEPTKVKVHPSRVSYWPCPETKTKLEKLVKDKNKDKLTSFSSLV